MFRRRPHGGTSTLLAPDEQYRDMRRRVLTLDPTTIRLASVNSPRAMIWGVMVDLVCADVSATVLALRDGTTSLYTDIGFSIIGAGGDSDVAAMSEELSVVVGDRVELLTGDPVLTLPAVGTTVFTTLTVSGPRSREVDTAELGLEHPLGPVLPATYAVLDALEAADKRRHARVS